MMQKITNGLYISLAVIAFVVPLYMAIDLSGVSLSSITSVYATGDSGDGGSDGGDGGDGGGDDGGTGDSSDEGSGGTGDSSDDSGDGGTGDSSDEGCCDDGGTGDSSDDGSADDGGTGDSSDEGCCDESDESDDGGDGDDTSPVVIPDTTCTLSLNPASIFVGESATLSWSTQNADNVFFNGSAVAQKSDSLTVSPSATQTYTVRAVNGASETTCSGVLTVKPKTVVKTPTCDFGAAPSTILQGHSATLSWNTTNAHTVTIDEGIGAVSLNGTAPVTPLVTTSYLLNVIGDGGTKQCHTTVTVTPVHDPVCSLSVDDTRVTVGESVTLSWNTENVSSVLLNGAAEVFDGSKSFVLTEAGEKSFVLKAIGSGKTVYCNKTVQVVEKPLCEISVDKTSILLGESATFSWTSQNAVSASFSNGNVSVPVSGSKIETPTTVGTKSATLTVLNADGSSRSCTAAFVVKTKETQNNLSCDFITASPSVLSEAGSTTLAWETTDATSVSINNGIGAVTADGSETVFVDANKTFVLSATDGADTVTCEAPVTIKPVVVNTPTCDAFTVTATPVTPGTQVTLAWSTTNADTVSINNGIGNVAVDGSSLVTINANTTFVLTAANADGSDSCQVSVATQTGGGGGGGGGSSAPRCELTASDRTIRSGEDVTLGWDNTRTNDILLVDSRGNIIVDTTEDADIDEDEDSIVVNPTRTTSYTLTAIRGSREDDCKVTIDVEDDITVSSSRSQEPLVAGISLSNVPYTGFEAGPVLTAVFYSVLVLWGFLVAYFLVMRDTPQVKTVSSPRMHPEHGALTTPETHMSVETPKVQIEANTYSTAVMPPMSVGLPPTVPMNLPTTDAHSYGETSVATVLNDEEEEVADDSHDEMSMLENRAHDAHVLLSSDAIRFILGHAPTTEERVEFLDSVISQAKSAFPSEDGWVVLNRERIMHLFA